MGFILPKSCTTPGLQGCWKRVSKVGYCTPRGMIIISLLMFWIECTWCGNWVNRDALAAINVRNNNELTDILRRRALYRREKKIIQEKKHWNPPPQKKSKAPCSVGISTNANKRKSNLRLPVHYSIISTCRLLQVRRKWSALSIKQCVRTACYTCQGRKGVMSHLRYFFFKLRARSLQLTWERRSSMGPPSDGGQALSCFFMAE